MIGQNSSKTRSLIIIIVIVATVFSFGIGLYLFSKEKIPDMSKSLAAVISSDVAMLTNKERSGNSLGSLKYNTVLAKAAQMKAEDMVKRGYFSHKDPNGLPPWKWLDQVGYNYTYAGENLGLNFIESNELIEAWMNSSLHRLNLLNKNYTEIGIGIASGIYDGKQAIFIVQFLSKSTLN